MRDTPFRYVKPFSYIEKHWGIYESDNDKRRIALSFSVKRERFFGLGVTYHNTHDYPIRYDENGNGHYSIKKEYDLMLTWYYFTLSITKYWQNTNDNRTK